MSDDRGLGRIFHGAGPDEGPDAPPRNDPSRQRHGSRAAGHAGRDAGSRSGDPPGRSRGSRGDDPPGGGAAAEWVDLLLVRHGRTAHNEAGRYQGTSDPPLSEAGREQARSLAGAMGGELPEEGPVWCSTLRRSRETARLAFSGREFRADPRLDELDFGELEGLTHEEAKEGLGDPYLRWVRRPEASAPPGGERLESLRKRVAGWLRDLPGGRTHVAVTHLGPIQVLTALVLELPLSRARRLKMEPGDWTRLLVPAGHEALAPDEAATPAVGPGAPEEASFTDRGTLTGEEETPGSSLTDAAADGAAATAAEAAADVRELAESVRPPPGPSEEVLRRRLDGLAKPPGSLGRVEELAVRLARVLGNPSPPLSRRYLFLFVADHGVTAREVSAYPREVTAAMCRVFARGEAASQALARACGVEVVPVDMGVDAAERNWPGVIDARVRRGSRDLSAGPALTEEEAARALRAGAQVARDRCSGGGGGAMVAVGEMGIGNTTAASAVAAAFTTGTADELVGPGTGVRGDALERKREIVREAVARLPRDAEPLRRLASVGGLEIAAMAGATLEAARLGLPVLVDGFISTAAALAAVRLAPETRGYLFASHLSGEPGHRILLGELDLDPILDLELRLGEGTGAILAAPILDAAGSLLREMATLGDVTGG